MALKDKLQEIAAEKALEYENALLKAALVERTKKHKR